MTCDTETSEVAANAGVQSALFTGLLNNVCQHCVFVRLAATTLASLLEFAIRKGHVENAEDGYNVVTELLRKEVLTRVANYEDTHDTDKEPTHAAPPSDYSH